MNLTNSFIVNYIEFIHSGCSKHTNNTNTFTTPFVLTHSGVVEGVFVFCNVLRLTTHKCLIYEEIIYFMSDGWKLIRAARNSNFHSKIYNVLLWKLFTRKCVVLI